MVPGGSSRLSYEESEELLYLGQFLHASGKIKENQKYELTKFALRSLLATLRRLKERAEEQAQTV